MHDGERLLTICGLTDDLHVGRWCEEEMDDLAILRRVIDDDDGQKNSPLLTRRIATGVPDAPAATVRIARDQTGWGQLTSEPTGACILSSALRHLAALRRSSIVPGTG